MENSGMIRIELILLEILQELKMQNNQEAAKEWPLTLDAKQAEAYSGIKKGKLYQYAKIPGFPAIRDETTSESGGRVFFSRDGLEKWVRENEGKTIR